MDADQDQRLEALKKAYVDIILNNCKEAASRVSASEKKAQRLEYELKRTKEEAIQMMLRLKKMMDDKIDEAKVTSRNKQEKIDELEAQLHEAEDILTEVREELRCAKDKLERAITNDVLPSEKLAASEESLCFSQRTESPNCYNGQIQSRNPYGALPELPSIISRSKRQEFYRKGCTQRTNSFERNISSGDLSISRLPNDVHSEGKAVAESQHKGACKTSSEGVGMTSGSKEIVNKDDSISCCYELQPRNVITLKSKATVKQMNNRCILANNNQTDENPTLMALKLSSARTNKEKQRVRATTTEMNEEHLKEDDVKLTISKDNASVISVPAVQDGASIESSIIQVSNNSLNKVAEPIAHSEFRTTKAIDDGPSLPRDHRVFKHTFQRKRKRNTLSISDGNVSVETGIAERKEEEEKTQSAEPEKSTSLPDSS